jgi:membrane protein DedA with SNARE-associated domain
VHFLNDDTVQHLITHYGYGAIFVIVMLESAGIPMPGETILVTAAVYAGTKHALDIRWVIAAAAGGAILGDNIGFWVGREFGEPLLIKWGHLVGLGARKRMLGRYLFARYGGSIVFLGRFVALLRAFAALLAGANRLSPWRFFVFNAAGGIVWATTSDWAATCLAPAYMASPGRSAGPCSLWRSSSVSCCATTIRTMRKACWPRLSLRWHGSILAERSVLPDARIRFDTATRKREGQSPRG